MKDYKRMTVGEIVADNFNNAGIFDKYGIDFCKLPILGCPLLDGHQQAPVKKRVHKFNDYYLHIVMGRRFS